MSLNQTAADTSSGSDALSFNRELIHSHVQMIHDLADQARKDLKVDGVLVLACYGENPDEPDKKKRKVGSVVMRFGIGQVDEMVGVIMTLENRPHLNVYVPFHIMRHGLERDDPEDRYTAHMDLAEVTFVKRRP